MLTINRKSSIVVSAMAKSIAGSQPERHIGDAPACITCKAVSFFASKFQRSLFWAELGGGTTSPAGSYVPVLRTHPVSALFLFASQADRILENKHIGIQL